MLNLSLQLPYNLFLKVYIVNDIKAIWVKLGVCIHIEVVLYSDSLLTTYKGSKGLSIVYLFLLIVSFDVRGGGGRVVLIWFCSSVAEKSFKLFRVHQAS